MKKSALIHPLFFFGSVLGLILVSCNEKPQNVYKLPTYSETGRLQCVIEIPAGTNKKYEINPTTGAFEIDQRDGKDRIINFIGYPGNYGFIPNTYADPALGGDGDALDVLVISESVPTGTVLEVIPIGMLLLNDDGELDDKIIAIPADPRQRTITDTTFAAFKKNQLEALFYIESWFFNYDRTAMISSEGWQNEKEAKKLIDSLRVH